MRRVGLVFLALGVVAFLFGSHVAPVPGSGWDDVRWAMVGVAVMGLVFIVLPGKPESP